MKIIPAFSRISLACLLVSVSACGSNTNTADKPGTQDPKSDPKTDNNASTAPESTASEDDGALPKTPDPAETPAPGSVEVGLECKTDADCKSNICRSLDTEGNSQDDKVCALCRDDAQCISEKKGLACKLSVKTGIVECVDGSLGSPCSKKADCKDPLMCALVNMGDNTSETKTCSECAKHVDCPAEGKRNCVSRDTEDLPGYFNLCLEDGVRKSGEVCFPCETGNRECAEGHCVKVDNNDGVGDGIGDGSEDNFCIGVCGACSTDADCPDDSRCVAPKLNFEKEGIAPHQPSRCEKK